MPPPGTIDRCAVVLAALCTCDGGPIDSGLPEDQRVDTLTPDEAQQLCDAARGYYERVVADAELVAYICTSRALAESGGEIEVCEEEAAACVADPPPEVEAIAADVRAEGICEPLVLASCEATVAEVEACLAEFAVYIDGLYAAHGCAMLADPPEPMGEVVVGPACEAIAGECPGLAK